MYPASHRRCYVRSVSSGWHVAVTTIVALCGCKAAREYAEKRYDERRTVEKAEERAAEDRAAKQEADRPPPPKPNGPGITAGTYRITNIRVAAFATTRKDKPWDDAPGEEPDLAVKIRLDGDTVGTCRPNDNAVNAHCTLDLEVELRESSELSLEVVDRDTLVDDPIGTATLTDPSTWGTRMELPMVPASRIRSASIVIATPPTWWDLHRSRMIGLCAGIGLAISVVGLFRRSLMPPPPAPAPLPRCSHCRALLGDSLAKCSECGAVQKVHA